MESSLANVFKDAEKHLKIAGIISMDEMPVVVLCVSTSLSFDYISIYKQPVLPVFHLYTESLLSEIVTCILFLNNST